MQFKSKISDLKSADDEPPPTPSQVECNGQNQGYEDEMEVEQQTSANVVANLDSGYAWFMLLLLFQLNSTAGGTSRVGGIMFAKQVDIKYCDREAASWPMSTASTIENLAGIMTPTLAQHLTWRQIEILATSLFVLAYVGAYFSSGFWGDMLCIGLVQGLALSINTVITLAINNDYFERFKTTAYGIMMSGSTCGILYMGPIVSYVLDSHEDEQFRVAYLSIGAVLATNYLAAIFVLPRLQTKGARRELERLRQMRRSSTRINCPKCARLASAALIAASNSKQIARAGRKKSLLERRLERQESLVTISFDCNVMCNPQLDGARRRDSHSAAAAAPGAQQCRMDQEKVAPATQKPPAPKRKAVSQALPQGLDQRQLAKARISSSSSLYSKNLHLLEDGAGAKGCPFLLMESNNNGPPTSGSPGADSQKDKMRKVSSEAGLFMVAGAGLHQSTAVTCSNSTPANSSNSGCLESCAPLGPARRGGRARCSVCGQLEDQLRPAKQQNGLLKKYPQTATSDAKSSTQQQHHQHHNHHNHQSTSLRQQTLQLLASPYCHCVWIMLSIYYLVTRILSITLVDFATDRGLSLDQASGLLNYWSVGEIIGRILLGSLIDMQWMRVKNCIITTCSLLSISIVCLVLFSGPDSYLLCAISAGFVAALASLEYMLINVLMIEYLGKDKVTSCYSLAAFISSFVLVMRPSLIGLFRDKLGSYDGLLILLAGVPLIYAILVGLLEPLAVRLWPPPPPPPSHQTNRPKQALTTSGDKV